MESVLALLLVCISCNVDKVVIKIRHRSIKCLSSADIV